MDYLLERKIRVNTEFEHEKWSIFEVDNNGVKANGDWVLFFGNLRFTAKSVVVHTKLTIEDSQKSEDDSDKKKSASSQIKFISGKLVSGYVHEGNNLQNAVRFSMFGTSRFITEFDLYIEEAKEDETEGCTLNAIPSYEFEGADLGIEVEPDFMGFEVRVSKNKLNELISLIESQAVNDVRLYVRNVEGIYSHWSPPWETILVPSEVKVLPRQCDIVNKKEVEEDVAILFKDGDRNPRYVGNIREFNLLFSSKKDLYKLPQVKTTDDDSYDTYASSTTSESHSSDWSDSEERDFLKHIRPITKEIKSLKTLLWFVLGAVVFILLR